MDLFNEKPTALANMTGGDNRPSLTLKGLKAFFAACLESAVDSYVETVQVQDKYFDEVDKPKTFAELAKQPAQLLSGEFAFCSHKAYGLGSQSVVRDPDTQQEYIRLTGDCRSCGRDVVKYFVKDNSPT